MNNGNGMAQRANKAAKEKQEADLKLIRAYKQVFGREGNRTAAQKLVWKSLEQQLRMPNHYAKDGLGNSIRLGDTEALLNEGARTFIWNLMEKVGSPDPQTQNKGE